VTKKKLDLFFGLFSATVLVVGPAAADDPSTTNDTQEPAPTTRDVKNQIPNVAYAYTAHGVSAGSVGVQAYGLGVGGKGQKATLGGGGAVWGSPIDRLTLIGDGSRDVVGNFAPSVTAVFRILGTPGDGFTLGALGKFKVEGFGTGPGGETESEIEAGILLSYAKYGWNMDANAITGFGTGDDGEIDSEGRFRLNHEIGRLVRLGVDSQMRYRLSGDKKLPGNRDGDFAAGPQVIVGSSNFFGSFTSGAATMGIVNQVGWTSILSIGGST
jgi:hypothetical protein